MLALVHTVLKKNGAQCHGVLSTKLQSQGKYANSFVCNAIPCGVRRGRRRCTDLAPLHRWLRPLASAEIELIFSGNIGFSCRISAL
jgi:hypothetical protein